MAKGRKLGSGSRRERLLGTFGYGGGGGGHGNGTDVSELVEEDVWSMVDDMENMDLADHRDDESETRDTSPPMAPTANGWSSHGSRNRRWSGGGDSGRREERMVVGGLSMAFVDGSGSGRAQESRRIVHQFRGGQDGGGSQRGNGHHNHMATSAPMNVPDWPKILRVNSVESMYDSDDGLEDGESERVPPHEYLAREYARTRKMTATSVLEGVGRTLKGRDLSRVRDAVWSQTGFDG